MAEAKENAFYSGDRYALDIQQAEAMRRSQRNLRAKPSREGSSSERSSKDKKRLTSEDVELALKGLDQADSKKEAGDYASALRIYKLSLELLLLFLRNVDDHKRIPEFDPSAVEARVVLALSDAEELKSKLPKNTENNAATPSYGNGLVSALSTAMFGRPKSSSPKSHSSSPSTVTKPKATIKPLPSSWNSKLYNSTASSQRQTIKSTTSSLPHQDLKASTQQHSVLALSQHHQAVLDDLYVDPQKIQDTSWSDIAGLEDVKQSLQESAILPLVRPDLFTGLRRPQNILLWGPPGTGKTMLVRAVAKESGSSLFACSASSLTSKWMGEAEKLVKSLFQVAQEMSPSLIFLDEVDAMLSSRKSDGEHEASRRLKTEFMIQMEGITSGANHVLVLACTNCPWDMDSAVLRRFPRRIFVPLPDESARDALLKNLLKKAGKHSIKKSQRQELVQRLDGFSCSDITAIASEASFGPIRSLGSLTAVRGAQTKDVRPINKQDFDDAILKATKSVSEAQLQKFENWRREQSAA